MTIHISKHTNTMGFNHGASNAKRCTICDGVLHYPFLEWDSKLFLCHRCCRKMKRGLIADLVHIDAISDLRELGYKCLLVRESEESLWHKCQAEQEAAERVMAEMHGDKS